jgi:hypothetical protein
LHLVAFRQVLDSDLERSARAIGMQWLEDAEASEQWEGVNGDDDDDDDVGGDRHRTDAAAGAAASGGEAGEGGGSSGGLGEARLVGGGAVAGALAKGTKGWTKGLLAGLGGWMQSGCDAAPPPVVRLYNTTTPTKAVLATETSGSNPPPLRLYNFEPPSDGTGAKPR